MQRVQFCVLCSIVKDVIDSYCSLLWVSGMLSLGAKPPRPCLVDTCMPKVGDIMMSPSVIALQLPQLPAAFTSHR